MADLAADAVVIGAGPCGAAAAWRLAAAGIDTLLLDRGGALDVAALGQDAGSAGERARRRSANPNLRRAPADYPVDDADSPIKPMIGNALGGSSLWWAAHVPRFRPEDFRIATLDGVGADWPIGYDDVAPYYDIVEARWGTAFVDGDPSAPRRGARGLTLPTLGPYGRRIAGALDRLGWHWWPVDLVVGRDDLAVGRAAGDPATARCAHLGPCEPGCPARRRAGADHAFVRDAVAAGARVQGGMRVQRLELDAAGAVAAAICRGDAGELRVRGTRFLVAANGMGTPRLLLLSGTGAHPGGLANRSGLVGRNLMLHPHARVDGLFPEPLGTWTPGEKAGLISLQFFATDRARGFPRGFKLQLSPGPGPLGLAAGWEAGGPLPWGTAHHGAFERLFDRLCGLTVCIDDLADPANRIALSDRLADADGLPAPRMIYRLSDASRRALDFGLEKAGTVLREAGATDLFHETLRAQAGFHLMGTTRMGTDPERSVVDPFGRAHDVPNLFVIDASTFVSGSAMNPTATAQALALRTADHIVATRRM
jgi:choline dehydrogenase-like flavoprotein